MATKLTQVEFLAKAVAAHGVGRYDYSQAVYEGKGVKIKIICPFHGIFMQTPHDHTNGRYGCPVCGREKIAASNRTTLVDFITRARLVHGDRYDYSEAAYSGTLRPKVKITCPEHGQFSQAADSHIAGRGCPECAIANRAKLKSANVAATFITRARLVHGDRYDYSEAEYGGNKTKVKIICRKHGVFMQLLGDHLQGKGCADCSNRARLSTAKLIKKSRLVHGDRYDYSEAEYGGNKTKVKIICPEHGSFEQLPTDHLQGHGCRACGGTAPLTTAIFITRARLVHGDRYDYSEAEYAYAKAKIKIICPEHGPFEQRPSPHMAGSGCPSCALNKLRRSWVEESVGRLCTLYFLRLFNAGEEFFKVGITSKSVERRFSGGHDLAGYQYEVLALHRSKNAAAIFDWEQSILESFRHIRYKPKMYFGGETECFSSCEEILAIFPL